MIKIYKAYFSHLSIKFYYACILLIGIYLLYSGAFLTYFYMALILLVAPFYEWTVHQFVLHRPLYSKNEKIQKYFDSIHRSHHRDPKKIEWVFAPISIGLLTPIIFFIFPYLVSFNFDLALTTSFFTFCYFVYYEWTHLSHHMDHYIPITKWGKLLKKSHTWHHHKNENLWWGVTNILGDIVLKTHKDPREVPQSKNVRNLW